MKMNLARTHAIAGVLLSLLLTIAPAFSATVTGSLIDQFGNRTDGRIKFAPLSNPQDIVWNGTNYTTTAVGSQPATTNGSFTVSIVGGGMFRLTSTLNSGFVTDLGNGLVPPDSGSYTLQQIRAFATNSTTFVWTNNGSAGGSTYTFSNSVAAAGVVTTNGNVVIIGTNASGLHVASSDSANSAYTVTGPQSNTLATALQPDTSLNASQLTTGTVPDGRISATFATAASVVAATNTPAITRFSTNVVTSVVAGAGVTVALSTNGNGITATVTANSQTNNFGNAVYAGTNQFIGTNSTVTETSGASGISVDATGKATFSIRTNISSGGGVTTNNVIGIVNSGQTAAVTNLFGVTNLYVYPFGTANGVRGSTTKPFGLLSQAVSNSVAGDTIFVMPGVYNETNHLISWQATPTNLSIYGIGLPEIDFGYGITNSSDPARGSPQKDYIQFRTGLLIDGLKLLCKTAVTNPGGGAAPYCSIGSTFDVPACSGVVIRNCYILGMSDCIFIDSTNSSEGLVDNCDLDGAWDCFTINRLASANQSWTIKNSRLYTTNFLYDIIGGIAQRRCLQVAQGTVSVIGTKFSYRSDRSNHEGVALHVDDPGQIVADGIILDPQGTNATYDLQGVYNGDNLVGLQLGSYAKTSFDQSLSFDPSSSPTFLIGGGTHYGEFVLLNRPIFDSDAGAWITSQWHFKDCATTNGAIKIINENNLLSAVESSITITPMNDNIGATVGTFNLTNIEMQVDAGLSKTTPNGTRVYLHLSNPVGTNSTATWTTTP